MNVSTVTAHGGNMLTMLKGPHFIESFKRKGRFVELMKQIPVHIVLTRAPLL
jgi:glucokinase